MFFSIEIENFLLRKKISFNQMILICSLITFLLYTLISGITNCDYSLIIVVILSVFLYCSFIKEIKKLYGQNQIVSFQKNVTMNGVDSSIFAFFVFSEKGKSVFINRVAQNLFSGGKIRTIEDFIVCFSKYPMVVTAIHDLQMSIKNMKQHHIDVPMNLNSTGVSLWRIAAAPLANQPGFSCWSIIDLTPSSTKIDSLETNSHFLMEILNNSSAGYFCIDANNGIIFCNNTFSKLIGLQSEDLVGTDFFKYLVKDEDFSNKDTKNISSKLAGSIPIKIKLKSSSEKEEAIIAQRIFEDSNGTKAYVVSAESQQSSELINALGKTKMYFEHIFEDAPVGILITDGAETINTHNHTFRNIVGVNKIEQSSFLDLVSNDEREAIREKLYQLITGFHQSIDPFEIQFNLKNPKTTMVYISKIEESKRTKDNDGLVMFFLDITERKELQMQFVQSQKMQAVGQLAGGIAHDFNNLLTAMIGYCDLLLEKCLPSDQSFNDVMQIKQNANRASNLVRQLLAFSRQQDLLPKTLNVTDIIGELSSLLKRLLGAKIDLKVIHGRDIGLIKVDQVQFEQIIINLAVNARDAINGEGLLTIQTSEYNSSTPKLLNVGTIPPGSYILIEVSDSGCGIQERYLNRIFDPFFSTKEKGSGTGLGLSTVYGIVNQTGGFISVESKVNVGTKFSLYFPKIASEETEVNDANFVSNEPKLVDLTGTATILLVEDEDAVRMFSSRALREKGYKVLEASDGESALEFIKKSADSIDLVITDVVMPKMDGQTLIENIKAYNPAIKVIFISGYTEDNFHESLVNSNRLHFLPKPFNLKELAKKVKEVIG